MYHSTCSKSAHLRLSECRRPRANNAERKAASAGAEHAITNNERVLPRTPERPLHVKSRRLEVAR
jgi:hypothetical protein